MIQARALAHVFDECRKMVYKRKENTCYVYFVHSIYDDFYCGDG